jgi:hypothetical protein
MVRANLSLMKVVARQIKSAVAAGLKTHFHICFIPAHSTVCEQLLDDNINSDSSSGPGITEKLSFCELRLGMVPFGESKHFSRLCLLLLHASPSLVVIALTAHRSSLTAHRPPLRYRHFVSGDGGRVQAGNSNSPAFLFLILALTEFLPFSFFTSVLRGW